MYKNPDRFFFSFITIYAFVRRTDGRTHGRTDRILIARPRLHSKQRGKVELKLYWNGDCLQQLLLILGQIICDCSTTVASLWSMSREAATNGVTVTVSPQFFLKQTDDLFSHHRLSGLQCHHYFSWKKNWRPFLLITVTFSMSLGVTPNRLSPGTFYLSDLDC